MQIPTITERTPITRRFSRALAAAVIAGAALASACRDDAGSGADPFPYAPWTATGPEVRIGVVEGDPDYVFGPVAGLEVGPDGLIYSRHGEGTIRRWTVDGQAAGTVGRPGEGPGEFQRLGGIGFFGDTLWAWDNRSYRASYFSLGGEFLGSVSPPVDFGSPEGIPPRPTQPFRDGTFLGTAPAHSYLVATGALTESPVARMDAEGNALTPLWTHHHEARDLLSLMDDDGVGGRFGDQPFYDAVVYTVFEDGLIVVERRAWTGEGEPVVTLTRIDLAGDTVFQRRIPYTPEPLPAERVDSAIRAIADSWHYPESGVPKGALEARIRAATYKPSYLATVGRVWVREDGNIWLERYAPVESDTGERFNEWWILSIDGEPTARARLPVGLRVMHLDEEVIWGTVSDDLDVDYIVRFRLVKGG